jgi:hypothetical protein
MASASYNSLLSLAARYMEPAKAEEVISRQLAKCGLTADGLSASGIKAAEFRLSSALTLYIPDEGKREELKKRISGLC